MKFKFDKEKALAAILYIANKVEKADFHKVSKILFFADQMHLAKYGRPVLGDAYIAMENGPVPSQVYDILKAVRGDSYFSQFADELKKMFIIEGRFIIKPLVDADLDEFSDSDIECIDMSIAENKDLSFTQLKDKSHNKAYHSVDLNNEISIEEIAKEAGANNEMLKYIELSSQNSYVFS